MSINYDSPPKVELKVPLFEDLTPGQQTAIENGPGWVKDPAEMMQFEDLEHFKAGSINFSSFFEFPSNIGEVLRTSPVFKRFAIVAPDLCEELFEQANTPEEDKILTNGYNNSEEYYQTLFRGYQTMSQLVDKKDPYIVKDGEVNSQFLCA